MKDPHHRSSQSQNMIPLCGTAFPNNGRTEFRFSLPVHTEMEHPSDGAQRAKRLKSVEASNKLFLTVHQRMRQRSLDDCFAISPVGATSDFGQSSALLTILSRSQLMRVVIFFSLFLYVSLFHTHFLPEWFALLTLCTLLTSDREKTN